MSTACMSNASSISARIALVQGSAPKMPTLSDDVRGSIFWARNSSRIANVARRHRDELGLEIDEQLDLALGHATRDRDGYTAEFLGAVMNAEAAGEKAVAIGIVDLHAGPAAARVNRARAHVRPGADIELGIADDRRLAGRTGRRVDADDLVHRHGEHAIGIIGAQIVLAGERKFAQVGEVLQIVRMPARRIEAFLIVPHVLVSMLERPLHAPQLQRRDLVARGDFDRVQIFLVGREVSRTLAHGLTSSVAARSSASRDWRSAPGRSGNRPARAHKPPCSGGIDRAAPAPRGWHAGYRLH